MSEISNDGDEVVIYQPSRHVMQSGKAKTKKWIIEFKSKLRKDNDPLMGWVGRSKTTSQIKLFFDSCEEAVEFAQSKGYIYEIKHPKRRKLISKSYSDNFSYNRKHSWTH